MANGNSLFTISASRHRCVLSIYVILSSLITSCINCTSTKRLRLVGRCGVVGSILAFGSIGHAGFESEHRLISHHSTSAFSKLRSLAQCSLDDSARCLLYSASLSYIANLRGRQIEYSSVPVVVLRV